MKNPIPISNFNPVAQQRIGTGKASPEKKMSQGKPRKTCFQATKKASVLTELKKAKSDSSGSFRCQKNFWSSKGALKSLRFGFASPEPRCHDHPPRGIYASCSPITSWTLDSPIGMTNTLILVLPTLIPFVASNNFPATPRRFSRFPADIKHDGFHQWLFFIGFVGAGIVAIWPSQSQVKDGTDGWTKQKLPARPQVASLTCDKNGFTKKKSCWGRIV